MTLPFVYDDGGRRNAGKRGEAGDCVCRSIAIASGRKYSEVYGELAEGNAAERGSRTGRTARNGIHTSRKWFKRYLQGLGFEWVACMGIGTGCKVHLAAGELPMGRLIVGVSHHFTAVIDGIIHDAHDPGREGTRCVYGYYFKPTSPVSVSLLSGRPHTAPHRAYT